MTTPGESRCRTCGELVLWCQLASGKWNPLDPVPHADGNISVELDRDGALTSQRRGRVLTAAEKASRPSEKLYRSHFSTCKDAPTWRRS